MDWFGWLITILFAAAVAVVIAVFAPELGAALLLLILALGGGLLFGGGIYDLFRKGEGFGVWKTIGGAIVLFIGYMVLNYTIIGTLALQLLN